VNTIDFYKFINYIYITRLSDNQFYECIILHNVRKIRMDQNLFSGEKVKQTTVVKTILNTIKELLLYKNLIPGSRLPSEKEMAAQFGVGKSSIREAIKMLDAVGVIESKQGYGTFICSEPKEDSLNPLIFQWILQQSSNQDLLNFRIMYESAYTFLAMDTMTEEDKACIKKELKSYSQEVDESLEIGAKRDANFHRAILKSTHNPYIIRTGEVLIDLFEATLHMHITERSSMTDVKNTSDNHKKIFDALCRKDRKALKKVLDKSFEVYGEIYLKN